MIKITNKKFRRYFSFATIIPTGFENNIYDLEYSNYSSSILLRSTVGLSTKRLMLKEIGGRTSLASAPTLPFPTDKHYILCILFSYRFSVQNRSKRRRIVASNLSIQIQIPYLASSKLGNSKRRYVSVNFEKNSASVSGWLAGIEQEHFRIFIDLPRKG